MVITDINNDTGHGALKFGGSSCCSAITASQWQNVIEQTISVAAILTFGQQRGMYI